MSRIGRIHANVRNGVSADVSHDENATDEVGYANCSIFPKQALVVLPAVEDGENGHRFRGDRIGDNGTPAEEYRSHAASNVISCNPDHGHFTEPLTTLDNGVGVRFGDRWRRMDRQVLIKRNDLGLRFGRKDHVFWTRHARLEERLWARAKDAFTSEVERAREGSAFILS